MPKTPYLLALLAALVLTCASPPPLQADDLAPFASDGCSLFPDGTVAEPAKWCDCCFEHDRAYWQGGTEEERLQADILLRECVRTKTGNATLAETMYLGVRTGGGPAFPTWYRWGYGWPFGRGYQPLSAAERQQANALLAEYAQRHPSGFCGAPAPAAQRPASWATPVAAKHLQNVYRLDDRVYRAAQPDRAGFRELVELGVTEVLNLRDLHDDEDEARGLPLRLHRVAMEAGSIAAAQVLDALRVIRDAKGPVLIHCWHGSDRTGTVAALYRIVFMNWSKEAALDELQHGGYGYHSVYRNIPAFIAQADVAWYRRELGLGARRNGGGRNTGNLQFQYLMTLFRKAELPITITSGDYGTSYSIKIDEQFVKKYFDICCPNVYAIEQIEIGDNIIALVYKVEWAGNNFILSTWNLHGVLIDKVDLASFDQYVDERMKEKSSQVTIDTNNDITVTTNEIELTNRGEKKGSTTTVKMFHIGLDGKIR